MKKKLKVSNRRRASKGRSTLEIHRLGPHPLIQHYLKRLNVDRILDKHIHSNRTGIISHGKTISLLVHNILVSRDPLYRLPEWTENLDSKAIGLSEEQKKAINDDRMGRSLEQLAEYGGRGVFFQLALRSIKLFNLDTSRVHFDTTSITFSGNYKSSVRSPQIMHGFNKDHRPDLKQLVFGLNVTSDGAVPLSHEIFSGNQTDDTLHKSNVDSLRDLLAKDDFIYVADGKLCTKENLKHISEYGGKFVTVLPRTRKEDSDFRDKLRGTTTRWRKILTVENSKSLNGIETYSTCVGPEKTEDGFRIIWLKSSAKAVNDKETREKKLEKVKGALKDLDSRLNQRKLKTRKQIQTAVKELLKKYNCEAFLEVDLITKIMTTYKRTRVGRPTAGDPKRKESNTLYELKVKQKTVRLKQERKTDGVFPLITNLSSKKKALEILQIYRYQPYLERRFQNLKTEYTISPIYLKSPKRIIGFLHACFIALMIASLIEREIRLNMQKEDIDSIPIYPEKRDCKAQTSPRIFELFEQVEWFQTFQGKRKTVFPVELTDLQYEVLKLCNVSGKVYDCD